MRESYRPNLHLVLIHYPVINKNGDTIASAVTNLDLHDIARLARTYGLKSFYVVTPLKDQKELVERIVAHWTHGTGSRYNPKRKAALETIRIKETLQGALDEIAGEEKEPPKTVATSAVLHREPVSFKDLRRKLEDKSPFALIFGTAWGMAESVINKADYLLEPVCGPTDYNHLSVRSAAAIILDRLVGKERS